MGAVVPVLLAGGTGARLWPWSTPDHAKPLLDLVGEGPMARATLRRLDGLDPALPVAAPVALTVHAQAAALAEVLAGTGARVLAEPAPRGTAPAVTAAAALARPDDVLLVLPADHHVRDGDAFRRAVEALVRVAAAGDLALLAVRPDRPEPGYGHVRLGAPRDGAPERWTIDAFVEKPDLARATAWANDGLHRWNAGIFGFRADAWLRAVDDLAPDVAHAAREAVRRLPPRGHAALGEAFLDAPAGAVDTVVFERVRGAVAVALDAGWSDVGTLRAVHAARAEHPTDNVVVGPATLDACVGCLVVTDRPLRVSGLVRTALLALDAGTRVEPLDAPAKDDTPRPPS
jgi:mannose-1-phosphate guanylyltransferase